MSIFDMSFFKKKQKDALTPKQYEAYIFNNIGARQRQEDSCAFASLNEEKCLFSVLADGMGGLEKGDAVSSFMTEQMRSELEELVKAHYETALYEALYNANEKINQVLGEDGLYKCGSTLLAVLTDFKTFNWISVGDSRIYLLRNNSLICLNEEHNYLNSLLTDVLNGRLSTEAAMQNSDAKKLTSFIGMGELELVDYSRKSIPIMKGDRILLMSDGVFGTVCDDDILKIMMKNKSLKKAATVLEKAVIKKRKKNQDNFSAVMIEFLTGE